MQARISLVLLLALAVACDGNEAQLPKKGPGAVAKKTEREANRLIHEKSPYLRQHAHNPVDWFPWGKAAFEKAMKEDKPIFLSIGYSSCHWCHVMEHESFDDEEVAAILNEKFVCIKVDREERPDVDEVYMNAISLVLRRQGGWPLSVWMTPDGKPFEGGTYFPKTARMGMPGFMDVLNAIAQAWADPETRKKIEADGSRIADFVQEVYDMEEPEALTAETLESAREMAEAQFDETYGGFGWPPRFAPKFPSSSSLELMLRWALRKKDETAMKVVDQSLEAMAHGGIHDHVGGGFHRYSTTRDWLVPHFEKMLYDNAQLLGLYAWAHLATGRALYAETARDVARWVQAEMTDPKGGFFSAQDADDPGGPEGEGGFYVWDPASIRELFDERESKVLLARFDITEQGNWPERPGKSLLQVVRSKEEVAKTCGVSGEEVEAIMARCVKRMYEVREKRPKPMTDTKVLSGWNGLMISGFAKAYQALGDKSYLDSALGAGRFLRKELIREGRLLRRWAEGEAAHEAVVADYAYVIAAFLDLYESTFELEWLEEALRLNRTAVELFYDPADGGFFFTAKDSEKLIARGKSGFDQARPSGNGVMALNLLRIAELSGDPESRERAQKTLDYFGARVSQAALGFSAVLNALDFMQKDTREIFIAGPREDPATRALIDAVWKDPMPNRVVALVTPGVEKLLPPARGKVVVDGKPAAYVCRNFTCAAPVTDPKSVRSRIRPPK